MEKETKENGKEKSVKSKKTTEKVKKEEKPIKKTKIKDKSLIKEDIKPEEKISKEIKEEKDNKQVISKDKDNEKKGTNFSIVEVIVIIIITGLIVSVCSALIVYNNYDKFKINSALTTKDDISEFIESYNHILNSYVKDVDKNELIDAAIKGMYDYLNDEYSIYIDEDTNETLTERLEGKYEGIGIEITSNANGEIYVSKVFSNTPAEEAGLKANDIITAIDDESLEGKDQQYLSEKIKKSEKDTFKITYKRDGEEKTVEIKRNLVTIDSVTSKVIDNIAYIQIETFSATTKEQVESKIKELDEDIKSIIIDLRDNSGGYLSAAYETSCLFTGKGKVVYQLKDKDGKIEKKTCNSKPIREFENITFLVNNNTASASEILAACLKENNGATLVGVTTFGKGTVQETEQLKSGAMVKYTSSYWLTPNGNSINGTGLEPDTIMPPNYETQEDVQLNKALELLK